MARLDEIFNLQMGKTPSRNNADYWIDGQHDWISIADLSTYQKYVKNTKEKISILAVQQSGIKIVPPNTVIMSFKLSLGKTAITQKDVYTNEAIMAFIPTEKYAVLPDYFYYLFSAKNWEKDTNRAVMGTTLNKATLGAVSVIVPPIDEQRKIAAILDKLSDLMGKHRRQLDKLDEMVKARFVEMFGDPVSNPKGWQLVPLGECVTTIDNGKSFVCSNETRKNEWPAILKLSAVTYGEFNSNENKALLDSSQFIENIEVHSGDLLFTRKNTPELVGMAAYVYSSPAKLMMPDLIFRLNTKDNCSKIFLWQLINHELFRKSIQNIASGSAKSMSNISKERLMQLAIYLPPIKLQNQFAGYVARTEKVKNTINCSLDKLETLKKALMQEYFE